MNELYNITIDRLNNIESMTDIEKHLLNLLKKENRTIFVSVAMKSKNSPGVIILQNNNDVLVMLNLENNYDSINNNTLCKLESNDIPEYYIENIYSLDNIETKKYQEYDHLNVYLDILNHSVPHDSQWFHSDEVDLVSFKLHNPEYKIYRIDDNYYYVEKNSETFMVFFNKHCYTIDVALTKELLNKLKSYSSANEWNYTKITENTNILDLHKGKL